MRRFRRLSSSQLILTAERLEAIAADLEYNINILSRFPELTEIKLEAQDLLCDVNGLRQELSQEIKVGHT